MLTITDLTCENFENPIGVDELHPQLSWKSHSTQRGARQSAYQVRVAMDATDLTSGTNLLWGSGKVVSDVSIHIPYTGAALQAHHRYYWQVRVWDENDIASNWSAVAFWEMGLLDHNNWQADWITPDWDDDLTTPQPAPILRRDFSTVGEIASARIYATALGLYELHLNGQRVGDALLTPGWTTYKERIQYQTYDVTGLLRKGENAIGAILGDGWYRGHLGFQRQRNLYGNHLALLLQLHINYADGSTELITSDEQWKASTGAIRMADLYWGEEYDAGLEKNGWDQPGYDDSDWQGVRKLDHPKHIVVAQVGPNVVRHEEIRPQRIFKAPNGQTILDFGQNMVGWVRLKVNGPTGATITLTHAEVLDQQGNLYTENLRFAKQIAQYTLNGTEDGAAEEVYEPRFTFMGFQFVAVDGFPGEPALDNFTGIVVHSSIPQIGTFECSNPMINQLQHNIIWGQKGNFVDVPTDCPQRDERLGYTGDAQAFIGTAVFNCNVNAFFRKWLADLRADQRLNQGSVSFVVPDVITPRDGRTSFMGGNGAAAWSDASTIIPWTLYQSYGDTRLLEESYPSMVNWVEWMRTHADEDLIWRKGFQFGDWLDYRGAFALKPSPVTNDDLVATAFFAYSSDLAAKAATILGKQADAQKYATLAQRIKDSFCKEFITAGGRVAPNSQTAYVLALHFDMLPEAQRAQAAARLAQIVIDNNYHLTTGFVGTPYLCHVLSRFGQTPIAYELLNQESFPSWLYPVKKGATTIWERWDGIKPDGSFQDAGMNSFNHYAYGAIGEWLYRTVAGIMPDPAEPGYKHITIAPQPGGGLTHVRATLESPYGLIESAWELTEHDFRLKVTVPTNSHATVKLPVNDDGRWTTDHGQWHIVNGHAEIEIGSGSYEFVTTALNLPQVMANVRHVAGRLDRYCTLSDFLHDERGKAILIEQVGGDFLNSPSLGFAMNQPLDMLARMMPGLLTEEKLSAIENALK